MRSHANTGSRSQAHPKKPGGLRRLIAAEAHHRLAVAAGFAVLTLGLTCRFARWPVSLIVSWDVFALCALVLAWLGMFFTDAKTRVRAARLQDSSRTAICCCLVLASLAGLVGAGTLLGAAKTLTGLAATQNIVLAAVTVFSSWLLVHTTMSLHYTHIFYEFCKNAEHEHGAGLVFPGEKEPDFLDFAYFSFVLGMTCQVADVAITSRRLRRIVLLHGLLSFAFNVIILGFSVNLASALL